MIGNIHLSELSNEVIDFINNSNNSTPAIYGELDCENAMIIVPDNYTNVFDIPNNLNYSLNDLVLITVEGHMLSNMHYTINNEQIIIDEAMIKAGDHIYITLLSIISTNADGVELPSKATDEMIIECVNDDAYMTPYKTKLAIDNFTNIVKNIEW